MINITRNNNLKKYNTFGIDVDASVYASFSSKYDLPTLFEFCRANHMDWYVLGQGSNTLFTNDFEGVIIHPTIRRLSILNYDHQRVLVRAEAGVIWDEFVSFCVKNKLYGAENLSGIPGSVGAAPVQNIGAYGIEAKDIIRGIEYYNVKTDSHLFIDGQDCQFGYRDSIFKHELKGQAIVTAVIFELSITQKFLLDYGNLRQTVEQIGDVTIENIRKSVLDIRNSKIPDPNVVGNAGSFFKNPIVRQETAARLKEKHPQMPTFDNSKGVKLSAAWLIEQAGWKGYREDSIGVNASQALILINYGGATGGQILNLANKIKNDVWQKFEVEIEMEVNIL